MSCCFYSKQWRHICIFLTFFKCKWLFDFAKFTIINGNTDSRAIATSNPVIVQYEVIIVSSVFWWGSQTEHWPAGQGPSSPALFVIHMSSRCSQGEDCVQFGGLRTSSLLFADDMVLSASSASDLHVFWDGLQLGWRSAPLTLRPWFSARKQRIHSLGWDGDSTPYEGV